MRKLASVQVIKEILPHPNADRLELAIINGWQCIVSKGKHKAFEKIVYFEIDSFLPIREEFEFLRKSSFKRMGEVEGYRLRTIKLRKEISQGLVMTFSECGLMLKYAPEGLDVTGLLDVLKYEPPIPACLSGLIRGIFPSFIRKTDQERIQNCRGQILPGYYEATLKLDGSSMTAYTYKGEYGVCSRNLNLKLEDENNTFVKLYNEYHMEERLKLASGMCGFDMAIQGEIMGPGIQGNREGFAKHQFFLFDIFNIDDQEYVIPSVRMMINGILDLPHAPRVNHNLDIRLFNSVSDFLEYADRKSINNAVAEGVVFKHEDGDFSFKAINNKFLLRGGD